MGATHFTFYNAPGMAPSVFKVLQTARKKGMSIDVFPWNDQNGHHELNQYMAINACLYWHMPYFEYSAMVDLDEYVSYRHGVVKMLPDLFDELRETTPSAAAFLFRHYLFIENNNGSRHDVVSHQIDHGSGAMPPYDIFRFTERHGPLRARTRSKVVCISDYVVTSSIHYIGEPLEGRTEVTVPVEDAALFHFRKESIPQILKDGTTDLEMTKYLEQFSHHYLTSILPE